MIPGSLQINPVSWGSDWIGRSERHPRTFDRYRIGRSTKKKSADFFLIILIDRRSEIIIRSPLIGSVSASDPMIFYRVIANPYPFDCSRHDHATEWPPITLDDPNDTTGRYGSLLGTTAGVLSILQNEII